MTKAFYLSLHLIMLLLSGCFKIHPSEGGGQLSYKPNRNRTITPSDIALPAGYKIEAVATGLTFPTGITFDENGRVYVVESGYAYGEVWTTPKLIRLEKEDTTVIARGTKNGPWNGVYYNNGNFYIAEGGELEGGKILKVSAEGQVTSLIENLPSFGDHHTNGPVVKDGYVYFGQGTATNSAIVGNDNADYGWLKRKENFHDIPCQDIVLIGVNYRTDNVLTENPGDKALTGAYSPYNTPTTAGQVIKGRVPCTGAIMRVPVEGGRPELVAWGLRNPYGLAYSPEGKLYITENSYDVRGSRPVWGTGDVLWRIEPGKWYGWPDFAGGKPIKFDEEFTPPKEEEQVAPLLTRYPDTPPKPAAILGVHSSSNGMDFSANPEFGYQGEAFIAQFGDMAPAVGKVWSPVGFKVVRVDASTGVIHDFAVNKGKRNGPASWLKSGGLERPTAVRFNPVDRALYVVDFGIVTMDEKGAHPKEGTGVVWKITREAK